VNRLLKAVLAALVGDIQGDSGLGAAKKTSVSLSDAGKVLGSGRIEMPPSEEVGRSAGNARHASEMNTTFGTRHRRATCRQVDGFVGIF
jgi:hypothetical protein